MTTELQAPEDRLVSLLRPDLSEAPSKPDAPEPAKSNEREPPSSPNGEAAEGEAGAPDPQTSSEGKGADGVEAPAIEIDLNAPLFEVEEVMEGGQKQKVKRSVQELIKGRMLEADYRRKTAEMSKRERDMEAAVLKAVNESRSYYGAYLQALEAQLLENMNPELKNVNWKEVEAQDPTKFTRLQAEAQSLAAMLQAVRAQGTMLNQQVLAERQQRHAKAAQQAYAVLSDPDRGIPGWGDEMYKSLMRSGIEMYGYAPQEVGAAVDPRFFKLLHDAVEYRKLVAAKPGVEKKLVRVPKVVTPGPGTERGSQQKAQRDQLRKELRKSGDVNVAARLLEDLL